MDKIVDQAGLQAIENHLTIDASGNITPYYQESVVDDNSFNQCKWNEAVKRSIIRLRKKAKERNEDPEITRKKIDAVRNRTPKW